MSKCLVAAIQSTQTLARRQSSAGLLLRFIQFACQTNLAGVPSQGRCCECIKTVKMATVTYSWHFLHLGMISTFDILQACPKIIILQLNTTASCCSPWLWISCTTHLLSNLHLTFIFVSLPLFPGYSSIFSSFPQLHLSLQPTIHPAVLGSFIYLPPFSFPPSLSGAISSLCSSRLNQASSAAATILVSFIYIRLTLRSLSLLFFSTHLSICQLFLPFVNLFLSSTPLNASVFP